MVVQEVLQSPIPLDQGDSLAGRILASDSLTTNSPDTPDGRPVIEVFVADPNILIYTSETAADGNLDVVANGGVSVLKLEDLKVNEEIQWQLQQEYKAEKNEFRRKITHLTNIESNRRAQMDIDMLDDNTRLEIQEQQQSDFDVSNNDMG